MPLQATPRDPLSVRALLGQTRALRWLGSPVSLPSASGGVHQVAAKPVSRGPEQLIFTSNLIID